MQVNQASQGRADQFTFLQKLFETPMQFRWGGLLWKVGVAIRAWRGSAFSAPSMRRARDHLPAGVVADLGVGLAGIQRAVRPRIPKHSKWPFIASLDFLTIPEKVPKPPAKNGLFYPPQNQPNYTVPFLVPRSFKIAMSG